MRRRQGGCNAIIVGALFVIFGGAMLLLLGQTTTLSCRRLEPRDIACEQATQFLGLFGRRRATVSGVVGAWVDKRCDEGCTYRVVLETERGDVPLSSAYTSGEQPKDDVATEIQRFVADEQQATMETRLAPSLGVMLTLAVFVVVGLLLLASNVFRLRFLP